MAKKEFTMGLEIDSRGKKKIYLYRSGNLHRDQKQSGQRKEKTTDATGNLHVTETDEKT